MTPEIISREEFIVVGVRTVFEHSAQDTRRIGTVENEEEEGDDNFFNMDFGDDPLPAGEHILTDGGTPQLIHFDGGNFEADARRLLAFLGEAASADRVDIWQIHKSSFDDDPEEYVSQLYEWSAVEREAEDAPVIAGRLLSQTIPNWLEAFTAGETINDPVKHMPPEERQALEELGVQSIMAAPVRVHGKLWGFIGLQDCRNERRFSQTDEKALMLASSMFDLLLQKQSMKGELDEARQARETASIQLEQALAREHELAGRAETSRAGQDEFLATMSREIVPPTQAIMEMIELVTHSNLTEGQREFLARADAAAKDLLQTMKDIVDMAKIEAGELAAENRPYDLGDVLGAVSSAMSDRAAERNLDFKIMVARGLPTGYVGDERRLGQVLINLVENALKYTEEGAAITITVDPAREVDYLSFKVKDTGRGLSQENMDELFTPLRLALSRELVFLMGGEMYCESEPGQGSTFYFTIQAPRIGG